MPEGTRVLVIAPHPDDESIGCGGAICLHTARGDRVSVVFLSSGELGLKHLPKHTAWDIREAEAEAARSVLGVHCLKFLRQPDWFVGERIAETAASLRPVILEESPQLVYVPHQWEWHPDHQAAIPVLRASLKDCEIQRPLVRAYEVWTPLRQYDHVEDITSVMRQKTRAIRSYQSQLTGFRYDRGIRGLNQYRGVMAGRCAYAEVFQGEVES